LTASQPDSAATPDSSMSGTSDAKTATADPPAQPSADSGAPRNGQLPRTASPVPVAFALGATALGAAIGLRTYRRRQASS
jgi:hypothetical protein